MIEIREQKHKRMTPDQCLTCLGTDDVKGIGFRLGDGNASVVDLCVHCRGELTLKLVEDLVKGPTPEEEGDSDKCNP